VPAEISKFTHRLHAWGVLGFATGGRFFSLLTLLFSGAIVLKTQPSRESFGGFVDFQAFLSPTLLPVAG
jgi:hypothetical protein